MTRNTVDISSFPLFTLSLRKLSLVTVTLPLASMVFCFITSMIFNFQLVNTTICDVFNFCPSVSAITGISPQRYIWRIGVALHSTPRLLLASVYYSHYIRKTKNVKNESKSLYEHIVTLNYWFHATEIMALVGVTYISNKENYPVHEKIFITFMAASISYMLSSCALSHMSQSSNPTYLEKLSYRTKLFLCIIIALTSLGMVYFFYKHRVYCVELAFSWFALCEYVICFANMAFHATIIWDMPDEEMVICLPHSHNSPNCHDLTKKND
ncbi:post-GPI attachment to proteins factor 2-like [Parasteatoda tepidariorum]|uniref:post-GPI attachment to proteins factor 2-like n=1 Tax=Parasteatoda tepidariorum TaxID=114398 RepID=UPI00077FCFB3|nr:post-GPI attachment to proteins factor 2-like [Parasteatoda tepidariorum]XP_015915678.1 post-GPI attachment to proteins factor 2-like [Parasteatoda tepidariorum]